MEGAALALVAFDFDGTLTVRDTFQTFLVWRTRGDVRLSALLRLMGAAIAYLFEGDRGRLKAAAVGACLRGVTLEGLSKDCERFADESFSALMRPDALAAWRDHQAQGDTLVIVTASPEPIVAPFARRLGADRLIGTRLEADGDGRLTGKLSGLNCRGAEKVRRLNKEFGPIRLKAAYGDSAGDREMLAIADQPLLKVFKAKPPRRSGEAVRA